MLAAQAGPASPPPDVTIRATTRLVEVTVVARDRHGVLVRDLKQEDFRVFDEGSPQKISFFSLSPPATAPAAAAPADVARFVPALPDVFSNRRDITSDAGASTIVLIDCSAYPARFDTAGWADLFYVEQAGAAFLRQIRPGDRVGIYVMTGTFIKILYEPTQDPSDVLKWLAARSPGLDLADALLDTRINTGEPDLGTIRLPASFHDSTGRNVQMSNPTEKSLALFAAVARHLAGVAGRKNLVWVSNGFTLATAENHENRDYDLMLDTMRVLNGAGVSLYAVDSRGLVTLQPDASVRPPRSSGKAATPRPAPTTHSGRRRLRVPTAGRLS